MYTPDEAMIGPKKMYRGRTKGTPRPVVFCQNPNCGSKLSAARARKGGKYCDQVCQREHSRILKLERRPKTIVCSNPNCGKALDPLSRRPSDWKRPLLHFCDSICADEYRRLSGHYAAISQRGNDALQTYRAKHGQTYNYEERARVVSEHNTNAPPKAKHFIRKGKVWGYIATSYPNENGDGYCISIPELPELGVLRGKTHKECLQLMRARFLEYRAGVRSKQAQERAETLFDTVSVQLNDVEFAALYNTVKAGADPRKCPGYKKAERLFTEEYGTRLPSALEAAFDRAMESRFGGEMGGS